MLREAGGNEEQCVLGTQTRQPGKQNALCHVSQNTSIYHILAQLYLCVLVFLQ